MARPKIEYNEKEVNEIINMKLSLLGGQKNKLTYNNVWQLNKQIANNEKYLRENGEKFNLYGYSFWSTEYKGQACFGRQRIDETKAEEQPFEVVGEAFTANIQDVLILVDKYHQKPDYLAKKLTSLFERERKRSAMLSAEVDMLRAKLKKSQDDLNTFQEGFYYLFYNSHSPNNSLNDVISLTKSDDIMVKNELSNMFNNELSIFSKTENTVPATDSSKILEMKLKENYNDRFSELDEEGW